MSDVFTSGISSVVSASSAARLVPPASAFAAGFGAKIFRRPAEDTGGSSRTLHECVRFYRGFPIVRAPAQLGWNRCRLLCQVADPARRKAMLAETVKRGWTSPQLEQQVRALALPEPGAAESAE